MFAVLKEGGKQYHVNEGDVIKVETMEGEVGSVIKLNNVMAISDKVGSPLLEGAFVEAEILEHRKTKKVMVFKFKRRQGYKRTKSHRQNITVLRIKTISSK